MTDPGPGADDWLTIWRSELAALASDREASETWMALSKAWMRAMFPAAAPHDEPPGRTRPDAPPRSPTAAAPSDAGGDETDRLNRRIAELEARIAELERNGGSGSRQSRQRRAGPTARRR